MNAALNFIDVNIIYCNQIYLFKLFSKFPIGVAAQKNKKKKMEMEIKLTKVNLKEKKK